jgi:DNA topoisomerase-1
MTIERGLELLAGRRAWELENGDAPKKSARKPAKKSSKKAPTLTENSVEGAGAKKRAKKSATGRSKKEVVV